MANFGALLFCANNIIYITQPSHCTPPSPTHCPLARFEPSPFPQTRLSVILFSWSISASNDACAAPSRVELRRAKVKYSLPTDLYYRSEVIDQNCHGERKSPRERERECAQEQCWHMRRWKRQWNINKHMLFSTHLRYVTLTLERTGPSKVSYII